MILNYSNNNYSNIKQVLINEFKISKRLITVLKKNNLILLNGNVSNINTSINSGDTIEINLDFPEEDNDNIKPIKMDLKVIYEDDGLIIIDKPFNMTVHPSISHFEDTLSNGIKYYFNGKNVHKKIRPVNRLDKDTSGLVVFAKNQYIQEILISQMKSGDFKKEYIAILTGYLDTNNGTIIANISRKNGSIIEREINENGEKAITHYGLIKNFEYKNNKLSLVKFILETGRTHQIRLHSKYIGHPILGDSLYGNSSNLISRQALHSNKISFINPINKEKLNIEIEIPEDMKKIIEGN